MPFIDNNINRLKADHDPDACPDAEQALG